MTTRRYFEVSVTRFCGEFVAGRVSRAFHDYWKDRDQDELIQHLVNIDDPDEPDGRDPESPPMLRDGTDPPGWYEADDIAHINGAVFMDGNYINVDEVVPNDGDNCDWMPFLPVVDGFSEQYAIGDLGELLPPDKEDGISDYVMGVEVEQDVDEPDDAGFIFKSIEKGLQTRVYVETDGDFDLSRLHFALIDMDGDMVIQTIYYDGRPLECEPDSSDGRGYYAWVGQLHVTGEDVRPDTELTRPEVVDLDEGADLPIEGEAHTPLAGGDETVVHRAAGSRAHSSGAGAVIMQVIAGLIAIGLITAAIVLAWLHSQA